MKSVRHSYFWKMKVRIARLIYPLLLMVIVGCAKKSVTQEKVDEIWINGTIHTMDSLGSTTEALVIKDGKILATGSSAEMQEKYSGQVRDLQGMHVYPGFIDAHSHFHGYGLGLTRLDLSTSISFDDMINKVQTYAETFPGEWIIGRGWDQNDWESTSFPNKLKLDILFPNRPVILKRVDGHAALVNQAALNLAGITSKTQISGGSIETMNGQLTGILIDNAVDLVEKVIPKPERQVMVDAILQAQKKCLAVGLTTVTDAGVDHEIIRIYDSLIRSGDLKIRIYAMLNPTDENLDIYLKKGPLTSEQLVVRSFKLYADGALGSRGALLKQAYCDAPGQTGLLLHDKNWLQEKISLIGAAGFQVNTHCIGDSANRLVLELYGEALKGKNDKRWRIEHAQITDPADWNLFGQFSILPSVQPTHATSDMYWAKERLCEDRMKGAYAFRSLMQQNGYIPLGTDFPVEDISPLNTYYAAVFRKDKQGYPKEGFGIQEALDPLSTLKGMTIWAAKASFMETFTGSIEPGKQADLVLYKEAIEFNTKPYELLTQETYISGKKLYSR